MRFVPFASALLALAAAGCCQKGSSEQPASSTTEHGFKIPTLAVAVPRTANIARIHKAFGEQKKVCAYRADLYDSYQERVYLSCLQDWVQPLKFDLIYKGKIEDSTFPDLYRPSKTPIPMSAALKERVKRMGVYHLKTNLPMKPEELERFQPLVVDCFFDMKNLAGTSTGMRFQRAFEGCVTLQVIGNNFPGIKVLPYDA